MVHAERKTRHGWCYVVALGDARGVGSVTGAGVIEADHIALDPPEPGAHLHWVVESGLQPIAEQYYDTDNWGSDARLYVEAIYHANPNRRGVRRNPQKQSGDDAVPGTRERTQQIWNSVEVKPDHAIWIPSPEFVLALRSQGAISSGSMSYEAWQDAKAVTSELVDWARYGAGFVVGVLEGAYGAVRDLVMGVAELFDMVYSIAKALVTEGLDALRDFGRKLYDAFENAPELLQQLGSDFATRWNDPDAYDRGGFHGEVTGYVLMQALILVLTLGSAAGIQLGGRFARVVQIVRALDAAADPLVHAGKLRHLARLPSEAAATLRQVLGKAGNAGDAVTMPGVRAATSRPDGHGGGIETSAAMGGSRGHGDGAVEGGASRSRSTELADVIDDAVTPDGKPAPRLSSRIPEHRVSREGHGYTDGPKAKQRVCERRRELELRYGKRYMEDVSDSEIYAESLYRKDPRVRDLTLGEPKAAAKLGMEHEVNGDKRPMVDIVAEGHHGGLVPIEVKNQRKPGLAKDKNNAFKKFAEIHGNAPPEILDRISHYEIIVHRTESVLPPDFRVTATGELWRLHDGVATPQVWERVAYGGRPVIVRRGDLGKVSR